MVETVSISVLSVFEQLTFKKFVLHTSFDVIPTGREGQGGVSQIGLG